MLTYRAKVVSPAWPTHLGCLLFGSGGKGRGRERGCPGKVRPKMYENTENIFRKDGKNKQKFETSE